MRKIVYKYLPIERLTYLEDEFVRFTPPGELNDPFECYPILPTKEEIISIINTISQENLTALDFSKFSPEESEKIRLNYKEKVNNSINAVLNNEPENFQEQFYNRSVIGINYSFGIFSLSRRWNSSLMWAHYTNSHKGFCIGFDKEKISSMKTGNPLDPTLMLQKVEYSNKRIKVPIERGVKIDPKILLTKSLDWEYEQEERMIALITIADKIIEMKPFNIHLFKIPHSFIEEIIVGAKIDEINFNKIKEFCEINNIRLYKCKISDFEFDMKRE
jgi:hypothetical protein